MDTGNPYSENAAEPPAGAVRPEIALPARRVLCAARQKSNLALV
jgi:hypothetical protein